MPRSFLEDMVAPYGNIRCSVLASQLYLSRVAQFPHRVFEVVRMKKHRNPNWFVSGRDSQFIWNFYEFSYIWYTSKVTKKRRKKNARSLMILALQIHNPFVDRRREVLGANWLLQIFFIRKSLCCSLWWTFVQVILDSLAKDWTSKGSFWLPIANDPPIGQLCLSCFWLVVG